MSFAATIASCSRYVAISFAPAFFFAVSYGGLATRARRGAGFFLHTDS
jgi:hypothetical protein